MDKLKNMIAVFVNSQLAIGTTITILFLACVEPINLVVKTSDVILVIDGKIDNTKGENFIKIAKSIPSVGNAAFRSEQKAIVNIIEDENTQYLCNETQAGIYSLPPNFIAKIGSFYKLSIVLSNGNAYLSEPEEMRITPPIDSIYVNFQEKGLEIGNSEVPAHFIYIDLKDNPSVGDNYFWTWKLYENQTYCKTCDGGIFLTSPAPLGRCLPQQNLINEGVIYDYVCNGRCWEIKNSQDLNIMADGFSNGNKITGRLVAKIPLYSSDGFLIEVSQQNVSPSAFRYLKILASQNQNTGTLVDSSPAPLIGNIKNIKNPFESVGGYFMVGNISIKRLFVQRQDAVKFTSIGLLGGRRPNTEPASADGGRPPFAPCIASNTRTPIKPEGWPF
jgi:hypothetical protein